MFYRTIILFCHYLKINLHQKPLLIALSNPKSQRNMKKIAFNSLVMFIIISIIFFTFKSYQLEQSNRLLKSDLIELSDVKYGLFNVDEWKEQLAAVITQKLKELKLTGQDKEKARVKIENFLTQTIKKFEISYKEENNKKSFFGISYKSVGADIFNIFEKLEERVPQITEDILTYLEKEENRENIKDYILAQLDKYRDSTFQKIDYSKFDTILARYKTEDKTSCLSVMNTKIDTIQSKLLKFNIIILLSYLSLLLLVLIDKNSSKFRLTLYILGATVFLILGVFLPMIDIDARIESLEFNLMGEPILFQDQVLYYKSKSIIEMSKIMLSQEKIQVMLVGLLVLLFSIIFPIAKLFSSLLILINGNLKGNKLVKFLVFKSGKWSMADVMVVAIFMSYIGFSGILSSQLDQLQNISENLSIVTTNKSELQSGFYYFLGFVILSISISQLIANPRVHPKN